MSLSLESLQLLVAAADSGSFSAAARRLGKAQSAVSTGIANLEIDLGLTLFDRSGRLPRLTAPGERMVAEARALLAQQGQLQALAAELAAGIEARLTLAIDDESLLPWLTPVLEQLAAAYPLLELELLFPMMEDLSDMLLTGRAQLAIGYQGLVLDLDKKTVSIDGEAVPFTKTEFELLHLLLEEKGRVFSRQELIDRVWPKDVMVLDRTVDVNITRMRKKVGRFAKCIVTRLGFGYYFDA